MPLPPVLNVGHSNFVLTDKILALVSSESAPMRRLVQALRKEGSGGEGRLIDATQGRRTKAIVFLTHEAVVLSAIGQETLARRLATGITEPDPVEPDPIEPDAAERDAAERDGVSSGDGGEDE